MVICERCVHGNFMFIVRTSIALFMCRAFLKRIIILIGGQAKTLMLVHINPEINAIGETISTLKFAGRVSSVELGAAHINKETGELRELKEEVISLP